MAGRITTKKRVSLIVEQHPETYSGYPFITLIQYKSQHVLSIIDNSDNKTIRAFVLDLCGPENVNEERIIAVASEWYEHDRLKHPISIEFSKRGMTSDVSRIYRTFNTDSIVRVIGPVVNFPMDNIIKVKRRKRRELPSGIEIHSNVIPIK